LHKEVQEIIATDPDAPRKTFEKFQANPKAAPTSAENVLLNAHYIDVKSEYNAALDAVNKANDNQNLAEIADARVNRKVAEKKVDDVEAVLNRVGTRSGQALQSRQMFADEDFNYVQLVRQFKAAKGSEPTNAELSELRQIADEHKAKSEDLEKLLSGKQEEIDALQSQVPPKHILDIAENYVNKLHTLADKERERLSKKANVFQAGIDPADLKSFAIIGADHLAKMSLDFAKFSDAMIKEFGEKIGPHLEKIFDESKKVLSGGHEALKSDADIMARTLKAQKTRMENRIQELETAIANKERIAKKQKKITPDQELETLREKAKSLKEDYAAIFPPERPPMSDARKLQMQKERIGNRIGELEQAIENKERITKPENKIQADTQLGEMRSKLKALKENYDSIFPAERRSPSDEQKLQAQKTRMENRIQEVKTALENNQKIQRKGNKVALDADAEKLKKELTTLNKQYKTQFPAEPRPPMTDAQRLQALEKRLGTKQKAVSEKIANKDFSKSGSQRPPVDPWAIKNDKSGKYSSEEKNRADRIISTQAEVGRLEKKYDYLRRQAERKNMGWAEWTGQKISNGVRASLLSNPITFAKLTASAAARIGTAPIKTGFGVVWSKAFKAIADKAPREGSKGMVEDTRNEMNAFAKTFTQGIMDFGKTISGKQSDLTAAFGKTEKYPDSIASWLGTAHEAFKTPAVRNEFVRSLGNRLAFAKLNGEDIKDPNVLFREQNKAYLDAQRMVFKEPNSVADWFNRQIKRIEQRDPATGKMSIPRSAAVTLIRSIFPITKIPTNIVKQSFEASPLGLGKGLAGALNAYHAGIENLTPEQADVIMRNLKAGSLGTAAYTLGIFLSPMLGGLYQKGEKQEPNGPPSMTLQIGGYRVPSWMLHDPTFNTMMAGATAAKVYTENEKKGGDALTGVVKGVGKDVVGTVEETPFVNETFDLKSIAEALTGEKSSYYPTDEFIKSRTIPQVLDFTAKTLDQNPEGHNILPGIKEANKRSPKTLWEHIETSIPGLRQNVPLRPESASTIADEVRSGNKTKQEGVADLKQQLADGKITHKQFKAREKELSLTQVQADAKGLNASKESDFDKIEEFLRTVKDDDKPRVRKILMKKWLNTKQDKSQKAANDSMRLRELIEKYVPANN
jgi:hypothetical protein